MAQQYCLIWDLSSLLDLSGCLTLGKWWRIPDFTQNVLQHLSFFPLILNPYLNSEQKAFYELRFDFWCNQVLSLMKHSLHYLKCVVYDWPKRSQWTYVILQLLIKHGIQELLVTSDGNKLENMEHGSVEGGKSHYLNLIMLACLLVWFACLPVDLILMLICIREHMEHISVGGGKIGFSTSNNTPCLVVWLLFYLLTLLALLAW